MALLDGHPQLLVAPYEMHFWSRCWPELEAASTLDERASIAERLLLRHFEGDSDYYNRYLNEIDPDEIKLAFRDRVDDVRQSADFLPAALLAYGQLTDQLSETLRYWVEKTPRDERFADHFMETWPHTRCIHVMRDPRSLHATYQRWQPSTLPDKSAYEWQLSHQRFTTNQARYGSDHFKQITYESLVSQPEATMRSVVQFLGIESDTSLNQATKTGGSIPWKGNSAFGEQFAGNIRHSSLDRWRETLTDKQVDVIEHLLGDQMMALGYTPARPASIGQTLHSLPAHGRFALRKFRAQFRSSNL